MDCQFLVVEITDFCRSKIEKKKKKRLTRDKIVSCMVDYRDSYCTFSSKKTWTIRFKDTAKFNMKSRDIDHNW